MQSPLPLRDARAGGAQAFDLVYAPALAVLLVAVTRLADPKPGLLALAFTALGSLALVWRERSPEAALGVATAGTSAYMINVGHAGPVLLAPLLATAQLVAVRSRGRSLVVAGCCAAAVCVVQGAIEGLTVGAVGLAAIYVGAAGLATQLAETERARRAETAQRQLEAARATVAEERLRIAQELHDVVSHGLATIALRAGVAEHLLDREPAEAREALSAIRQVSRSSLSEVSSLLGLLRGEDGPASSPTVGLAGLGELIASVCGAGLRVERNFDGVDAQAAAAVPDVVGVACYRIVQEALTNVLRHAGAGATASVELALTDRALTVEVLDDGRGLAADRPPFGRGLLGMRERALALGGELEVGAAPEGGFRVRARLPVEGR